MKRDPRLHGLSSDHHQALVLARSLTVGLGAWTRDDGLKLHQRFATELEPHFLIEEQLLLPALRRAGAVEMVERTIDDHSFLRAKIVAAREGDKVAATELGERLRDHVRFEERELFPACEKLLTDDVLDEVARRAPHRR